MTYTMKRDAAFAVALLVCLAGFGVAGGASAVVRAGIALVALVVVVAHVVASDEVARGIAVRAGAAAFAVVTGVAVAAGIVSDGGLVARLAPTLWAWLFALYLVCWSAVRLVRG